MNIASYIDHTILKPVTETGEVIRLCREAVQYGFAAVCVPPGYVTLAKEHTGNTDVKVATVIGFPFGYSATSSKLEEIRQALQDGADELDMVHNLTALKNRDFSFLETEMADCVSLIHNSGKIIKVIVESGLLSDEELIRCCALYGPIGIDFMKTSTGYAATGATVQAVQLMRRHLPDAVAIKASGGIRTFAFARELVAAGATRLGCSASLAIVAESSEA